jgi:hypothetical protein
MGHQSSRRSGYGHLVLVILLAVVVLGAAIWVATRKENSSTLTENQSADAVVAVNEATDATADWKTVVFNDLTIKYSPTWAYTYNAKFPTTASLATDVKRTADTGEIQSLSIRLEVSAYSSDSLEDAVEKLATTGEGFSLANKQTMTINGLPALRYNDSGCCGSHANNVFFLANGKLYDVSAGVGGVLTDADLASFEPTFLTFLSKITF